MGPGPIHEACHANGGDFDFDFAGERRAGARPRDEYGEFLPMRCLAVRHYLFLTAGMVPQCPP
jgi:hypothetical protein